MTVKCIGVDLAKSVLQVHGVDEREHVVIRKRLKRAAVLEFFAQLPACLVGIEACGSVHYWARRLRALGHEVRLMAPRFVKPHRKNDKNDGNDAAAVCEALSRPTMRFVAIKSEEQQALLSLHRARELLVAQRTALINQIRGQFSEYGVIVAQDAERLCAALPAILEEADNGLPDLAREMEPAQRLMAIDGVGPVTATAISVLKC